MNKTIKAIIAGLAILAGNGNVQAYDYGEGSDGRFFFSDGQEWRFKVTDPAKNSGNPYEVTAKLAGDTAIVDYYYTGGEPVQIVHPCKRVIVSSDIKGIPEARYAVYEWDVEIYAFCDKAGDFIEMMRYTLNEGQKILRNGKKWSIDKVDYAAPQGRALKRYTASSQQDDRTLVWMYRAGANNLSVNSTYWNGNREYDLISFKDADGREYGADDFTVATFVPDNSYFPENKEWKYKRYEGWYEEDGEDKGSVSYYYNMISGDMEIDHVNCKNRRSWSEGSSSTAYEQAVCSHAGISYAKETVTGMLLPEYDYTVNTGNNVNYYGKVGATETINVGGKEYRAMTFKEGWYPDMRNIWVEGIGGNSNNSILSIGEPMPTTPQKILLEEVNIDGTSVFTGADFEKVSAVKEINSGISNGGAENSKIYDLNGAECEQIRRGNVYIKDGKKIIY